MDYNINNTIKDIYKAGLDYMAPYWSKVTINLLKTGKVSHGSVLAKAMEICEKEEGQCNWPNIPEKYWKQAVGEMIGE